MIRKRGGGNSLSFAFPKFFSLLLCIYMLSFGHAHIFIDYKIHACIDNNGLKGVYVNWTFDRMFTTFIKKEFDKDKNATLDLSEQKQLFNTAFKSLEKNNYFTVIQINGKEQPIPTPQNFSARFITEDETVAYTFFLPLGVPVTKKQQEVNVYFFDPVIYVAFTIVPIDISIENKATHIQAAIQLKRVQYTNQPVITIKEL